jgi:hypothetical protein
VQGVFKLTGNHNLGFYIHFDAPTWKFKAGFGGRVIPTKRSVEPLPESQQPPLGPVLPSVLHDVDGEAVRKKAHEEQREEQEKQAMGNEDQGRRPLRPTGDTAQTQAVVEGKDDGVHIPVSAGNPSVVGDEDGIDMSFLKEMEDELEMICMSQGRLLMTVCSSSLQVLDLHQPDMLMMMMLKMKVMKPRKHVLKVRRNSALGC